MMRDPTLPKETIMNLKRELIALGVRILADKSNLVRKPDSFEHWLNTTLFGMPSYDQLLAYKIEKDLDNVVDATRRFNTNRKFKKITQNF